MKSNAKWLTINALSTRTHAERRLVARWMETEAVPRKRTGKRTVYERKPALAAIAAHRKANPDASAPVEIDFRRLAATLEHHLALFARHRKIIAVLCDGTERLLSVITSGELALSEAQAERLIAMIQSPWTECKQFIPADELAPEQTEAT